MLFTWRGGRIKHGKQRSGDGKTHFDVPAPSLLAYYTGMKQTFIMDEPLSIKALLAWGFPGGSGVKESVCNAGDLGSSPGLGRSPGEGNSCLLQYSCLENLMDRGAWQATRSRGLQRVGRDRATNTRHFIYCRVYLLEQLSCPKLTSHPACSQLPKSM